MPLLNYLKFKREQDIIYRNKLEQQKESIIRTEREVSQLAFRLELLNEVKENPNVYYKCCEKFSENFNLSLPKSVNILDSGTKEALEAEIEQNNKQLVKAKDALRKLQTELQFIRPHNYQDCEERKNIMENFPEKMLSIDPKNSLDLRFKGVSIDDACNIIMSQQLISGKTRIGYSNTSTPGGFISVGNIEELSEIIGFYAMVSEMQLKNSMPCGAMFVLKPESKEESDLIKYHQMNEVNFLENPEKLVTIVTSTENVPLIQEMLGKKDMPLDLAMSFSDFETFYEKKCEKYKEENNKNEKDYDDEER
jgi:hypothetical protein